MSNIPSHEVPECPCPNCGRILDRGTEVSGGPSAPNPDDLCICVICYTILRYNSDLTLHLCSKKELIKLKQEYPLLYKQLKQAQIILKDVKQNRN